MKTGIIWFRRDLRVEDNPALILAARQCERLVPVFIHAPGEAAPWEAGAASRWWLHHSLEALGGVLRTLGSALVIRHGPSLDALRNLIDETGAGAVFLNRQYEPALRQRDRTVAEGLAASHGLPVVELNGTLLHEPWVITKHDGSPYRVFSAYWRACEQARLQRRPQPTPTTLPPPPEGLPSARLEALGLRPRVGWDLGLARAWKPGQAGAREALQLFVDNALPDYESMRDYPAVAGTSRLSPHLHFGEITPTVVANTVAAHIERVREPGLTRGGQAYLRELGWREFAYHLLHHFPSTPTAPLDERFARFRWADQTEQVLIAWQQGQTGIPFVDAGMRELWHTGWMHNRVRMVVGSFLVKNLLVPWQEGARWFWDTLVDADLANNTLGWQWVAGCGADAAPYFRIFNPVTQGQRFDPHGAYVRRWVPELAALPPAHIQKPWQAPQGILDTANLRLGRDYPLPIVDLTRSRQRALRRFHELRARGL